MNKQNAYFQVQSQDQGQSQGLTQAKSRTQSLISRLAAKYGVDAAKLLRCLTTQVFKQTDGSAPSNEELMVLLLVCENYGLNPFSREIFAFRGKGGDPTTVGARSFDPRRISTA